MNSGMSVLIEKFSLIPVVAVAGLLGGACVNNQKNASADLPPANPAAYPTSENQSLPSSQTGYAMGATPAPEEQSAPPAPEFKPFALRDGENLVSHKVQKGDSLFRLASLYDTSVSRIQAANGLSDSVIYAGKTYKIPTRKTSTALSSPSSSPKPSESVVSAPPTPPTTPGVSNTYSQPSANSPASSGNSYNSNAGTRSYSNSGTTSSGRPTFAPRSFDYSNLPSESASSSNVSGQNSTTNSGGSGGAAFPTPDLGAGSSF